MTWRVTQYTLLSKQLNLQMFFAENQWSGSRASGFRYTVSSGFSPGLLLDILLPCVMDILQLW